MRRRAWIAVGVLAVGLGLGAAARELPATRAWNLVAGLCLLASLAIAVTLLPWWSRWRPTVKPLPGLFAPPRGSERWCSTCGSRTPRKGACKLCGNVPRPLLRGTGRDTPTSRGK